jgi:serine/threonine protein kinase
MGALYLAVSGEGGMEKLCAVKTVLPHLSDKEYLGRFRDEAKIVVRLQHGNLVTVFDAGQVGGELYLAMEFIEGKDLRAVWNRCARKGVAFPIDVAVHVVKELCRGLSYAHSFHELKLVHRDVSPPNVLCAYSGEVKLTDFGLASSTLKLEKTAPGVVYGKVSYMSPEQARGEQLDGRTDLYTAGILLWELLTGRQLFPQGDRQPGDLLQDVKDPKIEPPSARASRVPPELDAILGKALAVDPAARYQSGEEMRSALAGYLAQAAPATDAARIGSFLKELFGEDIAKERADREALLARARDDLQKQAEPQPERSTTSRKTAVSAPRAAAPAASAGVAQVAQPLETARSASGLVGTLLDSRYRVRALIGEGGMGRVYEAEHAQIGRRVAVKVLHPVYSRTPEVVERFRREARAASKIGHPNIVDVTDSGTTADGCVYFIMEFLEGVDLAKVITDQGALDVWRALGIASQICKALAAAHAQGIIHRDLKPENIFLVPREGNADFVKVLDFGIAKNAELEEVRADRLTHPGMAMGTPEYMAPEQAAGKPYDHRIDVYSIGAILYEMLCGVPPYEGDNFMEILTKKATQDPVAPRELRPELMPEVESLCQYALANRPEDRPPSAEALDYEITKLLAGRGAAVSQLLGIATPAAAGAATDPGLRVHSNEPQLYSPEDSDAVDLAHMRRKRRFTFAVAGGAVGVTIVLFGVVASRQPAPAATQAQADVTGPDRAPGAPAQTVPRAPDGRPTVVAAVGPDQAHARPGPRLVSERPTPKRALESDGAARQKLTEARRLLQAGRYSDARAAFSRLTDGKERGPALVGLAEVAFQQQSYGDAARLAQRAVTAGAGVPAHVLLGNCYFRLSRYSDAIAEYKIVLKAQPGHSEARRGLDAAERKQAGR